MNRKTIYALGFFDGVHLGHQALLTACQDLAQQENCIAGVVTFATHPDGLVLGKAPLLIQSPEERQSLLRAYGMENQLVLPFDGALRNVSWQAFLEDLVAQGAAGFVCGDDFRFGFRGEGTAALLAQFCREHQLAWAVVPSQNVEDIRVSSTHIRSLLEQGDVVQANRFLGHPYSISGTVVAGRQLGRTVGIPTANINLAAHLVCPKVGVYACRAVVDGKTYPAVTNIGSRPTVGGHQLRSESWLLGFDGDLYGKHLQLHFFAYLRPEEKFPSLEALAAEIRKDGEKTLKILEKY